MGRNHPSSIPYSPKTDRDLDQSELTCSLRDDEFLPQAEDFGIKLAADPYFYYTLDARHPAKTDRQELIELKLQIARQQEKLDALSLKLSQAEVENEALVAEKTALVEELASRGEDQSAPTDIKIFTKGLGDEDSDSAVRELMDANARLVTENARLQVVVGVMRKSFKHYIKDSRDNIHELESLHIDTSQRQQGRSTHVRKKSSDGNRTTATTSSGSCSAWVTESLGGSDRSYFSDLLQEQHLFMDASHRSALSRRTTRSSNFYSIPEEDWTIRGVDIEAKDDGAATAETRSASTRSTRRATRRQTVPGLSSDAESIISSRTNATSPHRTKADELLVDFGETRRPRNRRWSMMM